MPNRKRPDQDAPVAGDQPPADFDDTMRRVLGIPADRAKEIVERTAPGKPKAEREGKGRKRKSKPPG